MVFNKKLFSCLLSVIFCVIPALGSNNAKENANSHRQLLILSDNSEHIGGASCALSQDFAGALQSATCPILVNVELWRNYVEECDCLEAGAEQEGTPEKYVVDRFNAIESFLYAPENSIENLCPTDPVVAKNILVDRINAALEKLAEKVDPDLVVSSRIVNHMRYYQVPFDYDEWDVYKVNEAFYLFVPVVYKNICLEETALNLFGNKETSIEYALGLAVDHLEKITDPFDIDWMYFSDIDLDSYSLSDSLKTIFLSSYKDVPYVWDIVLSGHGINSEWFQENCPKISKLANMKPDEFCTVLDFFDTQVPTHSFWYTTCYGGGLHMQDFVLNKDSGSDRSFNLVSLCLTDTPSYGHISDVLRPLVEGNLSTENIKYDTEMGKWELAFNTKHNWNTFFSNVKENSFDGNDLSWILHSANEVLPKTVENIPLVLRAYSQNVITVYPDDCLRLSKEYCEYLQNASRSVMLDAKNISFVFLDESDITVPFTITSEEAPLLVSVVPGEAVHHLKSITAKNSMLDQVAAMFRPLKGITFNKTFVIDEIVCKPDSKKYGKLSELDTDETLALKNVVVTCKRDKLIRFFFETANGDLYKMYMTCNAGCDKAHFNGLKKIKSQSAQKAFKARLEKLTNS